MQSVTLTLNNGVRIPQIALGVWKAIAPDECFRACMHAFESGYRHIDTAFIYENEAEVGRAVRESGVPRAELFVTTKLWNDEQGYDASLRAFDRSLKSMGLDYVDLYLIHFPVSGLRNDSWKGLERIYREGRAKAIGVSNYTIRHLEDLFSHCELRPQVNQFEYHPYLNQAELLRFCQTHGIIAAAHTPLARGRKIDDLRLINIAKKYNKSAAQIMIRWCVEKGMVVVPKSTNPQRISDNINVFDFELSAEDHAHLDSLNEDLRMCRDATAIP